MWGWFVSIRLVKNLNVDLPRPMLQTSMPAYVHQRMKETKTNIANLMLTGTELFYQHRNFEQNHVEDEFDLKFLELIKNVITTLKIESEMDGNTTDTSILLGELEELVYGTSALVEVTSISGKQASEGDPEYCIIQFQVAKESGRTSHFALELHGNDFTVTRH